MRVSFTEKFFQAILWGVWIMFWVCTYFAMIYALVDMVVGKPKTQQKQQDEQTTPVFGQDVLDV